MKRLYTSYGLVLFVASLIVVLFLIIEDAKPRNRLHVADASITKTEGANKQMHEGKEVYRRYCAACHGVNGTGDGPESGNLDTKPADFTSGNVKFKSTPYGTLPTKSDIVTTLRLGVRTTAMLPQLQLSDQEMHAVAAYVLSLMPKDEETGKPIEVPKSPPVDNALLGTGKVLFRANCAPCHGEDARGDGPASKHLTDYRNNPIHPADLTLRPLKRANTPERMYMIVTTGIEGTPMPTFQQTLTPNQRWAIVNYVESLKRGYAASSDRGTMRGMMNGMMGGMMKHRLVGEEYKGMMIDMAAARAWMMGGMMK